MLNQDYWLSPKSYLIAPNSDLYLWYSVIITQRKPSQIIIDQNDNYSNYERVLTEKKPFTSFKNVVKGGFNQIKERRVC